jgi:transposase
MRQKYRCLCNGAIVTAPGPDKVIEGGRYTLQFAVQVGVDKYTDHQPLARQVRIMKRAGLVVDSQTLWDQLDALAVHLEPTYRALREYILGADVIGADETWWRLMVKKSNKRWFAWGITTHDACWYDIADSRSAKVAAKVLEGFEGTVLCDGYRAYRTVSNAFPKIRLAHCWAHARRKFVEAEPNYPDACGHALDLIGRIFAIEAQLPSADALCRRRENRRA